MLTVDMAIEIISLSRVNQFMTENKWARGLFKLSLITMTILYANNVFLMLLYCWGTPANNMTKVT